MWPCPLGFTIWFPWHQFNTPQRLRKLVSNNHLSSTHAQAGNHPSRREMSSHIPQHQHCADVLKLYSDTEPERNKRCTLKKEKNCIHFPANATVVHSTDRMGDPTIANIWKNCFQVSMHCTYKTMTLSKETSVSDSSVSTRAVSKTCPSSFNRQNT